MARSRTSKFDASEAITNELIRIIERGVLPWRKPWTAGGSARPLRHNSEPYQGVNNFLLTMRTVMAGYTSPFWMTVPQANTLGAKIRKGERSSVVVYYGQSRTQSDDEQDANDGNADEARVFRFQKSYRVFNADQIEGLPEAFHPDACPVPNHTPSAPIEHMQTFFDAIDIATVFGGTEARYNPPVDKVFMPDISRFKNPLNFYGVWAHELAHATKAPHRLNRDYGLSRFGNTAYSREEIVAELTSCFLGQELGFTAHIHVTRSLAEAEDGFMAEAVKATGEFDVFEPENDPDGCHAFGAVDIRGQKVFWKIDLYEADSDFRYGAETPDNPETTMRVLTIMMASDW